MGEHNHSLGLVAPTLIRPRFWWVRRVSGYIAPVLVLQLAGLLAYVFGSVPDEGGAWDSALLYGAVIIAPASVTAIAGLICAATTQGDPSRRLGTASLTVNCVLALVFFLPGIFCVPFAFMLLVSVLLQW